MRKIEPAITSVSRRSSATRNASNGSSTAVTRGCAALAVGALVAGWGVAQYPVLVPPGLTVAQAAAPEQTLPVTLAVLVAGFAVTLPSLGLLFAIFSRGGSGRRGPA